MKPEPDGASRNLLMPAVGSAALRPVTCNVELAATVVTELPDSCTRIVLAAIVVSVVCG